MSRRASKHEIKSSQRFLNPGWFTSTEESFYELGVGPWNLAGGNSGGKEMLRMSIWAPEVTVIHSREIYNALDFLGDVGGLFDGLRLIGAGVFTLFGPGGLQLSFLIGKIFYTTPD